MKDLTYDIHLDFDRLDQRELGAVRYYEQRFRRLYHLPEGIDSSHFFFACHAALPIALTPDLLYQIWINFQDEHLRFPYEVVSDLLLSGLCREVRPQLFEMETGVRDYLLQCLRRHPRLGTKRERALAQFLLAYASTHYRQAHQQKLSQSQILTAVAHLEPRRAAREIVEALNDSYGNRGEQRRLGSLVDALNVPLKDLPELLAYGRALEAQMQGRQDKAAQLIARMPLPPGVVDAGQLDIAGATLLVTPELRKLIQEQIEKLRVEAAPPIPPIRHAKIHLLTHRDLDGKTTIRKLFNFWPEEKARAIPIYTPERPQWTEEGEIDYLVYRIDEEINPVLDGLLLTPNGVYIIAVKADSWAYGRIAGWLRRLRIRLGDVPVLVAVLYEPDGRRFPNVPDEIKSSHPNVVQFLEIDSDKPFDLFVQEHIEKQVAGKIHPFPSLDPVTFKLLVNIVSKFEETPMIQRSRYFRILESYGIKDSAIDDFIFYLVESGRLIAPLSTLDSGNARGLAAGSVLINQPETFLNTMADILVKGSLYGQKGGVISREEFYPAWETTPSRRELEELVRLCGHLGLLFFDEKAEHIYIPALFPERMISIPIDFTAVTTTYLHYRFTPATPDLTETIPKEFFPLLQARLGAKGWAFTAFSSRELYSYLQEEDTHISFSCREDQHVLQVRIAGKGQVVTNLTFILNQIFTKDYRDLPHALDQRIIPAHATPALVLIEGGTYAMGDVMDDKEYGDEKPVHDVTLASFHLGRYAVTFDEYDAFCAATKREKPSDQGWGRGRRPAINVSWYDAVEYCNWLSEIWGLAPVYKINGQNVTADWKADGYRLPTEAEWEYAARQRGEKVRFGNGKDIADPKEINFNASQSYKKSYSEVGEYRQKTVPVGSLNSPNSLGLHDMSGNVWEWCWDWFDSGYYEVCRKKGTVENPIGPDQGSNRVIRGGSWFYGPLLCRAAYRRSSGPAIRSYFIGFRLARSLQF